MTSDGDSGAAAGAPIDLSQRLEARIGRPLTRQEREILDTPSRQSVTAEMSVLAYRLQMELDVLRGNGLLSYTLAPVDESRLPLWRQRLRSSLPKPFILLLAALWLGGTLFGFPIQTMLFYSIPVLAVAYSTYEWRRLAELARLHLTDGLLIERIVDADPGLLAIRDHVPAPWNWIYFRGNYNDLRGLSRLVTDNLDWYLAQPRTLLRLEWPLRVAGYAALFVIPAVFIFSNQQTLGHAPSPLHMFLGQACAAGAMLFSHFLSSQRRSQAATLLIAQLRKINMPLQEEVLSAAACRALT